MGATVTGDKVEWLTYAEAGARLGIAPESAKRRAQRRGWRRMPGNDGLARVGVPRGELYQDGGVGDGEEPHRPPAAAPADLEAENRELREALARSRGEADGLRAALAAQAEAHRAELARLDAAHRAELERVVQVHAAELARCEATHRAELDRAREAVARAQAEADRLRSMPGLRGWVVRQLAWQR